MNQSIKVQNKILRGYRPKLFNLSNKKTLEKDLLHFYKSSNLDFIDDPVRSLLDNLLGLVPISAGHGALNHLKLDFLSNYLYFWGSIALICKKLGFFFMLIQIKKSNLIQEFPLTMGVRVYILHGIPC